MIHNEICIVFFVVVNFDLRQKIEQRENRAKIRSGLRLNKRKNNAMDQLPKWAEILLTKWGDSKAKIQRNKEKQKMNNEWTKKEKKAIRNPKRCETWAWFMVQSLIIIIINSDFVVILLIMEYIEYENGKKWQKRFRFWLLLFFASKNAIIIKITKEEWNGTETMLCESNINISSE